MSRVIVYQLKITFPLALFKIPYTVKTRKTYLIPRKKAIVSIFNAFFEKPISLWKISDKNKAQKEDTFISKYYTGAELLEYSSTVEKQRIVQIKSDKVERPPSETELLVNAMYILYLIASTEVAISKNPINYFPFAGQNDYLASKWELNKIEGEIFNLGKEDSLDIELKNYQLIPQNNLVPTQGSEIIVENALEKYAVVRGKVTLTGPLNLLKVGDKIIVLQ